MLGVLKAGEKVKDKLLNPFGGGGGDGEGEDGEGGGVDNNALYQVINYIPRKEIYGEVSKTPMI